MTPLFASAARHFARKPSKMTASSPSKALLESNRRNKLPKTRPSDFGWMSLLLLPEIVKIPAGTNKKGSRSFPFSDTFGPTSGLLGLALLTPLEHERAGPNHRHNDKLPEF